jgi:hypothetical protein
MYSNPFLTSLPYTYICTCICVRNNTNYMSAGWGLSGTVSLVWNNIKVVLYHKKALVIHQALAFYKVLNCALIVMASNKNDWS